MSEPPGSPYSQHTVQRALLLGFAGKNKFLTCRSRVGPEHKIAAKHATTVDHFYTFYDEDGTERPDIDVAMQKRCESHFPALRTALQISSLTTQDRREFNLYVAFTLMRTTAFRDLLRQAGEFSAPFARRQEMAHQLNLDLSKMSPLDLAELDFIASALERVAPRHPREARIRELRTFIDQTDLAFKRLQNLQWRHFSFDKPALITSDAGVGVKRPDPDRGGILPWRGIVFLPLSPASLAVGATKKQHQSLSAMADLGAMANQSLSDATYEDTFRHPEMPWPPGIQLDPEPPRLPVRIERSRPGNGVPNDGTAALQEHLGRPDMHPFLRELMALLIESLPLT